MGQTARLTAALKQCLRAKGITYAHLAPDLGLSEASVKRIFSKGDFSLDRLEVVCRRAGVDFYDLARLARSPDAAPDTLSAEQEQALARDARLLTLLHLLLNDWTFGEILAEYALSEAELVRMLLHLERLRVIELLPANRVRLRCAKNLAWRPGGAVWATHERRVIEEFFDAEAGDARAHRRFEVRELSAASLAVLRRKLDKLAAEFNELAEMDSVLRPAERVSVGLVAACRPWALSFSHALRRRPPGGAASGGPPRSRR